VLAITLVQMQYEDAAELELEWRSPYGKVTGMG
jgi:hypothetical protein